MNIDLANVPPVPIQIGVAGENAFRTITFDASTWGADFPDATYTVVYKRSDGYIYPVLVNAAADAIVWSPTDTDTAVSGNGQIEVRLLDGETIGKTIVMQTFVAPSLSGDESEPSTPAPDWVNDVAADADRAEAAVSHYPQIRNDYWWVWDAENGEWVNTGVKATGEGGGSADAVLYTPQSLSDSQKAQARTNVGAGTYSKPSGGIPASDLASAVQTSLDKADTALQTSTLQTALDENVSPARFVLVRNGNTLTTVDTFIRIVSLFSLTPRRVMFVIITAQSGGTVKSAIELYPTLIDMNNRLLTLVGYYDSARYTAELTAASLSSTMTGTLVVEPIVTQSDIPTAVSQLQNDSGYQTATQVQTAISGVRQLPAVTASDNGKFLRVVNGAWAAETVQTWQGGSY